VAAHINALTMSVLLVDSYDSFTYNLRDLVIKATDGKAHVVTIHNDSYDTTIAQEKASLDDLLQSVDAIVIGPGPGSPSNSEDIGVIPYIYEHCTDKPILGICLGFQILCLVNGCTVDYLSDPIHGQVHPIQVLNKDSIFKNCPNIIDSVRYHSIYVKDISSSQTIEPLAVYISEENKEGDKEESRILMAAKHKQYPHYGVQYHPESICSTFGLEMVKNFWSMVNIDHDDVEVKFANDGHLVKSAPLVQEWSPNSNFKYVYQQVHYEGDYNILSICDTIKSSGQDVMLLNSASAPGEWSIVGLPQNNVSDVITHSTETPNIVTLSKWQSTEQTTELHTSDIFKYIADFVSERYFNPTIDNAELKLCPFTGGLIGYMSYEEGHFVDISKLKKRTSSNIDDTKLCFVTRFLAVSPSQKVYAVSIQQDDSIFLDSLASSLSTIASPTDDLINDPLFKESIITTPNKETYFKAFHDCQKYLHSGDSYELCLTYNTLVQIPQKFEAWDIYKALVKKNPSPYSAYLNFTSSMLLSTSPERFVSWTPKSCQMRPIKGTLRKRPDIDYAKACELLKIPKELGENLMIVDLIRDNLLYLLEKVSVSKLMTVEEYETIYQLVSVIDGELINKRGAFTGIDVFKNSLPPGSMTGAPKKRSVEILQQLEEQQRRGLYSGVCGYWSLNDNADWSVIIRSLFRYKDDIVTKDGFDTYRCGAGGALTVLSTDEGEWDEMLVKLHSVLQLFE
jgi:para-aminobenzoate synthetase